MSQVAIRALAESRARLLPAFCAVAGGGDLLTGILLLVRPAAVLAPLGLAVPAESWVFLRWIGVFVASVGAIYLHPWSLPPGSERRSRLRGALEITAFFRLAVAAFVAGAVVASQLASPWLAVGGYDALLALAQLFLLPTVEASDAH
jgi:hypothetical protein